MVYRHAIFHTRYGSVYLASHADAMTSSLATARPLAFCGGLDASILTEHTNITAELRSKLQCLGYNMLLPR